MTKLSIKDLSLSEKKILMRVDFNVPMSNGKITDDTRIKKVLPTIEYILDNNGSIILMSHLGRPGGKKEDSLSLLPIAKRLSKLLNKEVIFAKDCIGEEAVKFSAALKPKQILLLENLRFHQAEKHPNKDSSFAKKLSTLGDLYVNDAFGTCHRKHSSTYTICHYFPNKAASGLLLEKEIQYLGSFVQNPKRPFFAIIGGAKVSSKLGVIFNLLNKVDALFIGGGMSYTFFKAKKINMGKSLVEDAQIEMVNLINQTAKEKGVKLHLPSDIIIADDFSNDANISTVFATDGIPENFQGMDIGPKTRKDWSLLLQNAQTILWNGPVGVFEMPNFADGTNTLVRTIADSSAVTIVGGGDSAAAVAKLNLESRFTHLSTGGGASLEYIEQGSLPAIDVLSDKPD